MTPTPGLTWHDCNQHRKCHSQVKATVCPDTVLVLKEGKSWRAAQRETGVLIRVIVRTGGCKSQLAHTRNVISIPFSGCRGRGAFTLKVQLSLYMKPTYKLSGSSLVNFRAGNNIPIQINSKHHVLRKAVQGHESFRSGRVYRHVPVPEEGILWTLYSCAHHHLIQVTMY